MKNHGSFQQDGFNTPHLTFPQDSLEKMNL